MLVLNKSSRFHLVMQAIRLGTAFNQDVAPAANELIAHYEYKLREHEHYIKVNGDDPKDITEFKFQW
jgi:xylulose-5-phosphate/fructose-6-phosphate phosphoketolase